MAITGKVGILSNSSTMEPFFNASLFDREPPSLHDVQDLAKVYTDSSELLRRSTISITEIPELPSLAIRVNTHTVILSTRLQLVHLFPDHTLELQRHMSGPFHYVVLDTSGLDTDLVPLESLISNLPSEQRIAIHKDWRNALFKAMIHAARAQQAEVSSC